MILHMNIRRICCINKEQRNSDQKQEKNKKLNIKTNKKWPSQSYNFLESR